MGNGEWDIMNFLRAEAQKRRRAEARKSRSAANFWTSGLILLYWRGGIMDFDYSGGVMGKRAKNPGFSSKDSEIEQKRRRAEVRKSRSADIRATERQSDRAIVILRKKFFLIKNCRTVARSHCRTNINFWTSGLILLVFLMILTACGGKKEVKQVSTESRLAQEAFAVAEVLRSAYVKKDFSTIAENCTATGYRDIVDSIKHFDSAELTFTPRWVEIEGTRAPQAKLYLNIAWRGSWSVGGDTIKERGMAVFLFEGRPLKLSRIVRGNPFKYPAP